MALESIGRARNGEAYKYTCDHDGCDNEYKFVINGDLWNGWQLLEVYEEGAIVKTKYLCPKHHIV